jgi:hypothetical protein
MAVVDHRSVDIGLHLGDDFAALAAPQRAELDAAVQEAATAIQARVMDALVNGELRPTPSSR